MTKTEYNNALAAAKIAYDDECKKIKIEYAKSNNHVNIGDVITSFDGQVTIKVERIEYCCSASYPECRYIGTRLKKDGTPYKTKDPTATIYQSNVVIINNEPYKYDN